MLNVSRENKIIILSLPVGPLIGKAKGKMFYFFLCFTKISPFIFWQNMQNTSLLILMSG